MKKRSLIVVLTAGAAVLFACGPTGAQPHVDSASFVSAATVDATSAPAVDFSAGFTASGLSLNQSALSGTRLRLTDGGGAEARSAFFSTAVNVQSFTTDFTFQLTNPSADGFTFVIQNNLASAVGSAGSGLGYQGIGKSVAVKFDLYNSAGEGPSSTGLYVNGAAPTMPATTLTGVDLHSGHVLSAHLVYAGTTLALTLTDPSTGASYNQGFTIDIPGTVGATTAYVGFTAGTGGLSATQEIVTWSFGATTATTTTPPPVAAPVTPAPVASGAWVNVTPAGMNMNPNFGAVNSNFGVDSVVVDPVRPCDLYASADYQGVWKSTDYGLTWKKVSTGTNGTFFDTGRPWFLGIDSNKSRNPATAPAIWTASGYGKQFGLYKSTDGGVNWTHGNFPAFADGITNGQDPSSIDVDPYDGTHLIMGFHGTTEFAESIDGGGTWKVIAMPAGVGTSMAVFFIDTGAAATTRTNWLVVGQWVNNTNGAWHTSNGTTWDRAGTFEHFHGSTQVFNAGNNVAYLSATGGVYKTTNGGISFTNINGGNGNGVIGTPSNLYTSFGWSTNGTWDPQMATASRSADTKWTAVPTPAGMLNGDKHGAVTFDGAHYVLVTSNGNGGIWRFVEGGSTTVIPPPVVTPPAITISVAPATATVAAGGTVQLAAAVTGTTDTAVIWSLLEATGCGTINASGLYTAPAAAATCHAVATSHASSAKTATAVITVSAPVVVTPPPPPPVVAISMSPVKATVVAGKTQAFTCAVTGSTNTACTWSASSGSISAAGLFTAPATAGVLVVVAKSVADVTKTASAAVTVTAAATTTPPPTTPPPATGALPSLQVVNGSLLDPHGNKVILRGLNSQGMGMVYGDKANPGTYVPMTPLQYVNRAVQTDATGNKWSPTAIRLNFERFPCTDPSRLYTVENTPYAMPDTIAFNAWAASSTVSEGQVAAFGGKRYRAMKRTWRADRGASWNPGTYAVGDIVSGYGNGNDHHLYRATVASGGAPSSNWGGGPSGVSTTVPVTDAMGNQWLYAGEFGVTGAAQPFSNATLSDYSVGTVVADHFVWWQFMSADYTQAQALANFNDWKAKVMDPAIQAAINAGLYVVVTDFDFGPAQHPLRHARMLDFWTRMAQSQWANNPQVIFELWNESEDIGSYAGGAGSWVLQKPVIQETINAVRAAGANNLITVPTPFFSAWVGEATASPLTGSNIAYSLHAYRSQWEAYSSNRDQITQGLASGQAIMMTEWGDDTNPASGATTWATTSSVLPSLRQLLEPSEGSLHPPIGMFAWAMTSSWSPDLFGDAALTQPTSFGVGVRQWLSDKKADSQPVP